MHKPFRPPYSGPALFSYGFRPFFLAAGVFAVLIVPLWMLIWSGNITLNSPFPAMDWHIHEMLFGYTSAVIAGFLFTAVPNWTGRMPTRGWPPCGLPGGWPLPGPSGRVRFLCWRWIARSWPRHGQYKFGFHGVSA